MSQEIGEDRTFLSWDAAFNRDAEELRDAATGRQGGCRRDARRWSASTGRRADRRAANGPRRREQLPGADVAGVPMAKRTSLGLIVVSRTVGGETLPRGAGRRSSSLPLMSPIVCRRRHSLPATSSSRRYSTSTSTTPLSWGWSAGRAFGAARLVRRDHTVAPARLSFFSVSPSPASPRRHVERSSRAVKVTRRCPHRSRRRRLSSAPRLSPPARGSRHRSHRLRGTGRRRVGPLSIPLGVHHHASRSRRQRDLAAHSAVATHDVVSVEGVDHLLRAPSRQQLTQMTGREELGDRGECVEERTDAHDDEADVYDLPDGRAGLFKSAHRGGRVQRPPERIPRADIFGESETRGSQREQRRDDHTHQRDPPDEQANRTCRLSAPDGGETCEVSSIRDEQDRKRSRRSASVSAALPHSTQAARARPRASATRH